MDDVGRLLTLVVCTDIATGTLKLNDFHQLIPAAPVFCANFRIRHIYLLLSATRQ
jgi:hypothetical protein